MATGDVKKLAQTASTNPSALKSVAKNIAVDNSQKITSNPVVSTINRNVVKPTSTISNPSHPAITPKPALFQPIPSFNMPSVNMPSTLSGVSIPKLTPSTIKPSLTQAPHANSTIAPKHSSALSLNKKPMIPQHKAKTTLPIVEPTSLGNEILAVVNSVNPPPPPETPTTISSNPMNFAPPKQVISPPQMDDLPTQIVSKPTSTLQALSPVQAIIPASRAPSIFDFCIIA